MTDENQAVLDDDVEQQPTPAAPDPEQGGTHAVTVDGVSYNVPNDLASIADDDEREYWQTLVEAANEGKEPAPPADPAAPETTETEKKPEAAAKGDEPGPMIPKPRFDEATGRLAQAASYWKGRAEAAEAYTKNGGGQATQQPGADAAKLADATPEQKLQEIETKVDALAERFDNGEITLAQYEKEKRGLANQEHEIRSDMLLAKLPKPQQPSRGEDLFLAQQSDEIAKQHAYTDHVFVARLSDNPAERQQQEFRMAVARGEAMQALQRERPDLTLSDDNPVALLAFRQKLAEVADRYGPVWFPNVAPKAPAPASAPGTHPNPAGLTPQQQARLDKLDIKSQQPPSAHGIGHGTGGVGALTEDSVMGLTDDQIADLSEGERARLLGAPT